MEVSLTVPMGTDVSIIRERYPDLWVEESSEGDETQEFWIGQSMAEDESNGYEWMSHDECIRFCGFCEGAIPEAYTLLEGNGAWAQGMMKRRDFRGLALTDAELEEWKAGSDLYWSAFEEGQIAAKSQIGKRVIDSIVSGKLFSVSCPDSPESRCVVVWSANAPEQLTALIEEILGIPARK